MYNFISPEFMPSKAHGRASVKNSCSMATASVMTSCTACLLGRWFRCEKRRQAKSVCKPSSREMSSLLNVRPGIRPRFLSQNIDAKEPLKKIPSTAAKATRRCANVEDLSWIHFMAQSAFLRMHGTGEKESRLARSLTRLKGRTHWCLWHQKDRYVAFVLWCRCRWGENKSLSECSPSWSESRKSNGPLEFEPPRWNARQGFR